jgi:hypothetical protein
VYGQSQESVVDADTPLQLYRFVGTADESALFQITSESSEGSPTIIVQDEATARTLSTSVLSSTGMSALTYRFAAGTASYLLKVAHSGANAAEPYRVCLWTASAPGNCADETAAQNSIIAVSPTAQSQPGASAPPATDCIVTAATGGAINVRRGPGTIYPVVGSLSGSQTAPVIGRLNNNSWYQISYNGQAAWVGSTVVTLVGNCGNVPIVQAPALPTQAATTQPTQPGQPTATMTPGATLAATSTATMQPTATATNTGLGGIGGVDIQPMDTRADLIISLPGRQALFDANGNLTGYRIHAALLNRGYTDSGAFTVRICLDGVCNDHGFGSIAGGGPETNQGYGLPDVDIGPGTVSYVYEVYVDIYNDVNEISETNNLVRWEGTI